MIEWLIQSAADNPQVAAGLPSKGLLTAPEMAVYDGLRSAKRRKDWLLGRWTAKQLIRTVEKTAGNKNLSYREISILAAQDGAPEVWLGEAASMGRGDRTLSISHAQGIAFCATTPGKYALGADIEAIELRSSRFVENYFTREEKELVLQAPAELRDTLITAIWSGKEAALKVVRQGLRLDTRSISCHFPSLPHISEVEKELKDWHPFSLRWSVSQRENGYPQLCGWWRVWQDFVLTLVVTAEPQPALGGRPDARSTKLAEIS